MFLVNLYILINLPRSIIALIESIKEYKRMFQKQKITIKSKLENYRSEI